MRGGGRGGPAGRVSGRDVAALVAASAAVQERIALCLRQDAPARARGASAQKAPACARVCSRADDAAAAATKLAASGSVRGRIALRLQPQAPAGAESASVRGAPARARSVPAAAGPTTTVAKVGKVALRPGSLFVRSQRRRGVYGLAGPEVGHANAARRQLHSFQHAAVKRKFSASGQLRCSASCTCESMR